MKTAKKAIALALILMLGIIAAAGCGDGNKPSGKYILTSMVQDGETLNVAEQMKELKEMYEEMGEEFNESDFESYLEFSGDEVTVYFGSESVSKGAFKMDGKNIEITSPEGEVLKAVVDGNKITVENEDEDDGSIISMIFEKK